MTTMLERMAAAQYAVLQAQSSGRLPVWGGLDEVARVLMRKQVRAGLKAMREPVPRIVQAGCNVSMEISAGQVFHAWQAMLDAILAEVPK